MNPDVPDCIAQHDWLSRPLEEADFEVMQQDQEHALTWRTEAPMESLMLFCSDGGATHEEYITIEELADRLSLKPKTIRNKMASGIFNKGTHYVSPRGLGPRFKWSAIVKYMESGNDITDTRSKGIPMARGYNLGQAEA